jgi:hypothetical protein
VEGTAWGAGTVGSPEDEGREVCEKRKGEVFGQDTSKFKVM